MRVPGFVVALISGLCASAAAQEIHTPFCLYGCPTGTPATNDLIVRSIYALSSNDDTKFADWVAYYVTKETIGPTKQRVWRSDPALSPEETLEPDDYVGANAALQTDRGHQVPLASFASSDEWEATNYLSNITPQKSALNQGPWERLESAERALARRDGVEAVFVLTGPLYQSPMPALPKADESHRIPSGYWKIVAIETDKAPRVAAFVMHQDTPRDANYCDYSATVDEVERASGLRFFPARTDPHLVDLIAHAASLKESLGCQSD